MAHLSSCYFCGAALEAPVETYELSGQEAKQATVSLCSSCKEKLSVVLDAADLGTIRQTGAGQTSPADSSVSEGYVDKSTADADPDADDESDRTLDESVETVETESEQGEESKSVEASGPVQTDAFDSDGFDDELAVDVEDDGFEVSENGDDFEVDESNGADETEVTAGTDDPDGPFDNELLEDDDPLGGGGEAESIDDDPHEERSSSATEGPADKTESAPASPEESSVARASDDGSEGTTPGSADTNPEKTGAEATQADDDRSTKGDSQQSKKTISALEYNRVMRMLQNREFPVDRNEIEVVAANAYDLEPSECAQVIDLAVDRGLLDERDGELYRPGD